MKTKHPLFSSVAPVQSVRIFSDTELVEMTNYRNELMNTLVYEPPIYPNTGCRDAAKAAKIFKEIQRVEGWLKNRWTDFINDNNRKLTA